ncbi:MAG: Holliday junction branch migration protein RuvA [Mogibacterium sp.]|nr:Holliday junction branch migration protein RuvA [Mogibacterium sp.]
MIRTIRGEYLYYEKGAIVIRTAGGIGFRVFVPDVSPLLSVREGDEIEVYTYLQVREDGMSLFGFPDHDALQLFEQLITVNGIGPKAGLAIMSLGTPNQIRSYIVHKDAKSISQAQGVGKKTAERVILELADKVSAIPSEDTASAAEEAAIPAFSDERNGAVLALTTLGYTKAEAESAISQVKDEDLTIEDYIRKALKYLL